VDNSVSWESIRKNMKALVTEFRLSSFQIT
jgi:hypothetical protein